MEWGFLEGRVPKQVPQSGNNQLDRVYCGKILPRDNKGGRDPTKGGW